MKIVYPDYDRSILSTLNSCLRYYGAGIAYPTLPELDALINTRPRHVMLLLLDGMGKWPLHRALKEDSYLRDREIATVTSIYPSTTAAATTAYFAAQSALEHGWLGWHVHMKEYAADVILFQSRTYHTEKPVDGPEPGPHSLPFESTFERVRRFRPEICTTASILSRRIPSTARNVGGGRIRSARCAATCGRFPPRRGRALPLPIGRSRTAPCTALGKARKRRTRCFKIWIGSCATCGNALRIPC